MTTTYRAARALDLTHAVGERGPRTMQYRAALAEWLDGVRKLKNSTARVMCLYLESIAP